eukprot:2112303-Alexandrium_andersonii.AAC.1
MRSGSWLAWLTRFSATSGRPDGHRHYHWRGRAQELDHGWRKAVVGAAHPLRGREQVLGAPRQVSLRDRRRPP